MQFCFCILNIEQDGQCAQSMQSLHQQTLSILLTEGKPVCNKYVCTHYEQTMCTLKVGPGVYAEKVCTKSANASFMHTIYADNLHTKYCKMQQCAPSLHMHTLCIQCVQTICTPSSVTCKSVLQDSKSADAHFVYTLSKQNTYYMHTFECISIRFQADCILE